MKLILKVLSAFILATLFETALLVLSSRRHHVILTSSASFEPPVVEEDFTSACLLVMDENHRLGEWLAYHYTTVRLRHVVIAVDPRSRTSPSDILGRFRPYMTIEEWTDADFTRKNLTFSEDAKPGVRTQMHRNRQNQFQMECIMHLKEQGRRWTLFVDPDEYVAMNPRLISDAAERIKIPFSIYRLIKEYTETTTFFELPPRQHKSWIGRFHRPCVVIPRIHFGSHEDEASSNMPLPAWLVVPNRLDTLRWVYRGSPAPMWGKTLIDLSRVLVEDLQGGSSAHFPIHSLCSKQNLLYDWSPVGVHHYQGTWEAYSFRQDARKGTLRNYENWKLYADDAAGGKDDSIQNWIFALEQLVGIEVANLWLRDNGLPPSFQGGSREEWARIKNVKKERKVQVLKR